MKKYTKYKDTGIEWLGEIPEHWEIKPLKYLLQEIISGGTPETSKEEYWDNENGINWVSIADITKSDNVLFETEKKISEKGANSKNLKIIKKGTLLISIFASLGKIIILGNDSYVNQAILALIPKSNLEQSYLKYYFYFIQQYLDYYSSSNTQDNLNAYKIKNLTIPQPDLSEQLLISNLLEKKTSEIDILISNKEKLIELLKEERTAIINRVVTKGINPKAKMKDSGVEWLGEIPEHWEVKKVRFVLNINEDVISEKTDEDYIIKYIDIGNVSYGNLINPPNEIAFSEAPSRARRITKKGDTILSTVRTYLKAISYIEYDFDNLISSTGFAVISPTKKFISKYVFYLLSSHLNIEFISYFSKGISYPAIDSFDLSNIKIGLPPILEQNEILEYLEKETNKIDTAISVIEKEIELIQEYRTALISEAVTGKIDLRN